MRRAVVVGPGIVVALAAGGAGGPDGAAGPETGRLADEPVPLTRRPSGVTTALTAPVDLARLAAVAGPATFREKEQVRSC